MEKKVIEPFYHPHPLTLTQNESDGRSQDCYGCGKLVNNLDMAYVCMHQDCIDTIILHKRCGELPSEIWHPKHPQHPLHLYDYHYHSGNYWCDLCCRYLIAVLGYQCSSCNFDFDITCEHINIDAIFDEKTLHHPSHLDHPLTLMRKSAFAFHCDGCGTQDVDLAYICSICEFWIHKSCALLPLILPTSRQPHHHDLSLAFSFPEQHRNYIFYCDLCHKILGKTCWVYFCGDCRFFVHLKCVTSTAESTKRGSILNKNDDDDGSNVIQFPLHVHDISKELITPFVMREKGLSKIPDVKDLPTVVNMSKTTAKFSFLFNYHKHHLSLVSESNDDKDHKEIMDEDEEDEAANHDELKICDVCVTPILSPPYYECAACKYFVHSICYLLPKTLSSSPSTSHLFGHCTLTLSKRHEFTLYTSLKSIDSCEEMYWCQLCYLQTNGMVYECEGCKMKIDVKCMSLPTTIKHASHSYHKQLIMARIPSEEGGRRNWCHTCLRLFGNSIGYRCNNDECNFALDFECAMLPLSMANQEWDKHPLLLTFDASLDHPSDFYCQICEEKMHPKKWMYHCRQCDNSFHQRCIKTAARYRNIKLGRQFVLDSIHPHPLTFNWITLKIRCDICRRQVYDYCGLECVLCYYVVCLRCGRKELVKKMYFS